MSRRAVLGLVAALALVSPSPPAFVHASAPAALADAPRVALLSTAGERTSLHWVRAGETLGAPVASFEHREGSVRGALLPDGAVLAAAPASAGRDRSYDGGLWRLAPQPTLLCDRLTHASRPLVSPDGRVFVVRGRAGGASDRSVRIDELTVDRIDPQSGDAVTLHRYQGYLVHVAGWHDGRVLLYRIGRGSADIVAMDATSGALGVVVAALPPFARDFSVLGDRLVYRGRHERDSRAWVVDAVDLDRGARQRLYEDASFALAPHVWPDGGVALNPEQRGLMLLGSGDAIRAPLGAGVDMVRALSADGRFVAVLHTRRDAFDVPFLIDRATGQSHPLAAPGRTRLDIVGFEP